MVSKLFNSRQRQDFFYFPLRLYQLWGLSASHLMVFAYSLISVLMALCKFISSLTQTHKCFIFIGLPLIFRTSALRGRNDQTLPWTTFHPLHITTTTQNLSHEQRLNIFLVILSWFYFVSFRIDSVSIPYFRRYITSGLGFLFSLC